MCLYLEKEYIVLVPVQSMCETDDEVLLFIEIYILKDMTLYFAM